MTSSAVRRKFQVFLIPALAVVTALLVGAIIMLIFGDNPIAAYRGLFEGAFGSPRNWAETVRRMTPLILTGLSVAVAFKAGLFNIGASGQFIMGTVFSVAVGVNFEGLPMVHPPAAGHGRRHFGRCAVGRDPRHPQGLHRRARGDRHHHAQLHRQPFRRMDSLRRRQSRSDPRTPLGRTAGPISETADVFISARIPWLFGDPYRVHGGVVIALLVAMLMWWIIFKTTLGFETRTVGLNSKAAKYAGINVNWIIILTMMIAGGLAGLAGAIETLGLNHKFAPEFTGAVGFDGITVALLGQTNPIGVVLSAFLLAALDAGASQMQFDAGVSQDIIQVIQALVLAFVAAPLIIRQLYRIKKPVDEVDATVFSSGWGK